MPQEITDGPARCSHPGVATKENDDDWKFLGLLPMCVAMLSLVGAPCPSPLMDLQVRPSSFGYCPDDL